MSLNVHELLEETSAVWKDQIGTHYPGCYTRHVGCLAHVVSLTLDDALAEAWEEGYQAGIHKPLYSETPNPYKEAPSE